MNRELIDYKDGCRQGTSCLFCHGWKELEYHQKNYKK